MPPWQMSEPTGDVDDMTPDHPCMVEDAYTRALWMYKEGGARYAMDNGGKALRELSAQKCYHGAEAALLLLKLKIELMSEIPVLKYNQPIRLKEEA